MQRYCRNDILLVRYPFSDLSAAKVRPAVVVSSPHPSEDIFVVPLTSNTRHLLPGEFVLIDWQKEGLNVPSAAKRGINTISSTIVICAIGKLSESDANRLRASVLGWVS